MNDKFGNELRLNDPVLIARGVYGSKFELVKGHVVRFTPKRVVVHIDGQYEYHSDPKFVGKL